MPFRCVNAAAFALAAALAMWSCGGSSGSNSSTPTTPSPSPAPATTVTVTIVGSSGNRAYNPNPVQVNTGDTLAFKNADATMHHIVMDDGSADLGEIAPGATRSMTLRTSGGNYHCTIHSTMVGSVNGKEAPMPPDCNMGYC